eukprot:755802-Hanusia_phi.AAC.2
MILIRSVGELRCLLSLSIDQFHVMIWIGGTFLNRSGNLFSVGVLNGSSHGCLLFLQGWTKGGRRRREGGGGRGAGERGRCQGEVTAGIDMVKEGGGGRDREGSMVPCRTCNLSATVPRGCSRGGWSASRESDSQGG